jgi:tetratricopeptide (TPR) repeat protein
MPDIFLSRVYKRNGGDTVEPRLNVIFVHGLGGDPVTTWCYEGGATDGYFWLRGIAEQVEGAAVYTLGYPADKAVWNTGWPIATAATAVLEKLMASAELRKVRDAPIAFVCHSLGGLIVKKLVLTAYLDQGQDKRKGRFLDRIAGVVFLATPHRGSILASIAEPARWFVSKSAHDLKDSDEALLGLNHDYLNRIANKEARIRHQVYYETLGKWGAEIVTLASADLGAPEARPIPVNRDHFGICKPVGNDDPVFEGVCAFLQDDVLQSREPSQNEKFEELLAIARAGGAFIRAAEQGISEAAVRAIVQRLGGEGIGRDDLVPWLDNWITTAISALGSCTNEDEVFEAASREAERRFKAGLANPSAPLMDEFAHEELLEQERQKEGKRRRLRILDAAVRYDELAFDTYAAVEKLRRMAWVEGRLGWGEMATYLFARAEEFDERGHRSPNNAALLVAIATFRAALEECTHARMPLFWAEIQHGLGKALWHLGERENSAVHLEEAAAACRAALAEFTHSRPENWHKGLGVVIVCDQQNNKALQEWATVFSSKMRECTHKDGQFKWADIQVDLGNVLRTLGEREGGTANIKEAEAAYNAALKEYTRERHPLNWAMLQNNLGVVYRILGERENSIAHLEAAVTAYRSALEEFTRSRFPLKWAMTQNNLGTVLFALGKGENGIVRFKEAVTAYRAALQERKRSCVPLDWAATQTNLSAVLSVLGEREGGTARLKEAVAVCRAALKKFDWKATPFLWAGAHCNLGNALVSLGKHEHGTTHLAEGAAAYRQALKGYTREHMPLQWAQAQVSLGITLAYLGERECGTAQLEDAIVAFRAALQELTPDAALHWHNTAQQNLAHCLTTLEERRER